MFKVPLVLVGLVCAGCASANRYDAALHTTHQRKMSVGSMAKEICQGMTQSTLAAVLGSPNIITKDQNGTQTWIYDKITREVAFRQDPDGQWLILEGYERSAAARDKTAKNLMVIVKFDEHECIEKVSCHSSKF